MYVHVHINALRNHMNDVQGMKKNAFLRNCLPPEDNKISNSTFIHFQKP